MEQEVVTRNSSDVKLSMGEKVAFAGTNLACGGAQVLVAGVYLVFLVLNGLDASLASTIMMIAQIMGSFLSPIVSLISDNTRTKWGRRKPYIFVGSLFFIFVFAMILIPLNGIANDSVKFAYYLISYLAYSAVNPFIGVPYTAMASELTSNYREKNNVNTLRMLASSFSSCVSSVIPIFLLDLLYSNTLTLNQFSILMICGFGIFYTIPMFFTVAMCKERIPIPKDKYKLTLKNFLQPLKLKPFVLLLLLYCATFVGMDVFTSNLVFLVNYGLGIDKFPSFVFVLITTSVGIFMTPVFNILMRKGYSKSVLYRAGIPLYLASLTLLIFCPTTGYEFFTLIFLFTFALGMCCCQTLPWFIFPDVVDMGELKFGERKVGPYMGLMMLCRKTLSAIAIGIWGFVLDSVNFAAPVTDPTTGYVTVFSQPESAIWGIKLSSFVPIVICAIVAIIVSSKLKLSKNKTELITKILNTKTEDATCDVKSNLTEEELKLYNEVLKDIS
ncbi:MAG: MFS transporter [Bacillota bacterium]